MIQADCGGRAMCSGSQAGEVGYAAGGGATQVHSPHRPRSLSSINTLEVMQPLFVLLLDLHLFAGFLLTVVRLSWILVSFPLIWAVRGNCSFTSCVVGVCFFRRVCFLRQRKG